MYVHLNINSFDYEITMVMSFNLYKNSISIGENRTKIAQSHLAVALYTKHAQGT